MNKSLSVFIVLLILCNTVLFYQAQAKASGTLVGDEGFVSETFTTILTGIAIVGATGIMVGEVVSEKTDEMLESGRKTYANLSESAKEAFRDSIAAAQLAGSNTIALTGSVLESITLGLTDILVQQNVRESEKNLMGKYDSTKTTHGYDFTINSDYVLKLKMQDCKDCLGSSTYSTNTFSVQSRADYAGQMIFTISGGTHFTLFPNDLKAVSFTSTPMSALYQWNTAVSGTYAKITFVGIVSATTGETVAMDSIYDPTLKRALEQDIPYMKDAGLVLPMPEAYHPTTNQRINVDSKTGTMTLPDGTIHQGDVTWKAPPIVTGVDTVGNPAVGYTGTIPRTVTDEVTGEVTTVTDNTWTNIKTGETVTTGGGGGGTPPGETAPGKINFKPLVLLGGVLTTQFPFSIPWDVYKLFSQLDVEPITPVFKFGNKKEIELGGIKIPIDFKFNVDFTVFDPIAKIARWGLILAFDIALIMALRRLTPD